MHIRLIIFPAFTLLLCCLTHLVLKAQDSADLISFELKWSQPKTYQLNEEEHIEVLNFEGAYYSISNNHLPSFSITLPVPAKYGLNELTASLENTVFQPLNETSLIRSPERLFTEIQMHVSTGLSRKKAFITVSFLPIRKSGNSFEKLTAFSIRLLPTGKKMGLKTSSHTWASNSVLASGTWYKIAVKEDGVYKLDYNSLRQLGFDMSSLDPRNIRIFGNGIGMLPELNSLSRPDDLIENAIEVVGEADGIFNNSDYILFYGRSPDRWVFNPLTSRYQHSKHLYSDYNFYFVTADLPGPAKRIQPAPLLTPQPGDFNVTTVDHLAFHEQNLKNYIKSGRQAYGETFDVNLTQSFSFNIPNLVSSSPVWYNIGFMARSTMAHSFLVNSGGQQVCTATMPTIGNGVYEDYGKLKNCTGNFNTSGSGVVFDITYSYNPAAPSSVGYLDFIEINARRTLAVSSSQFTFSDRAAFIGGNAQALYIIQGFTSTNRVWDVTDPYQVAEQPVDQTGSFTADATNLREFVLFRNQAAYTPVLKGMVPNQNLHALGPADMIIVSHPLFIIQANRLADLHRTHEGLTVHVVDINQVFNEFSGGTYDVPAIRDFVKMMYDRSNGDYPKYLLLFGDGSYDNKTESAANTNFIPTYQSENSLSVLGSYQSDDFFGLLDDSEGAWPSGSNTDLLDIGIGRLPAKSKAEAASMVDKIYRYVQTGAASMSVAENEVNTPLGDWRNIVCFVADDEDGSAYIDQSDTLMKNLNSFSERFNIDKIYLDAYQQISTAGGQRYPDVNTAIDNRVNKGALLINYVGHGGELGWAHEKILDNSMINSWKNSYRMPLFITATCEFSRFDDPARTSSGEYVLLKSDGGGIGLYTTTRLVYAYQNAILNKFVFRRLFEPVNNEMPRLGDVYLNSKRDYPNDNARNFTLLGDPAVRLAYPHYDIVATEINAQPLNGVNDTIRALSKVTFKGEVRNNGTVMNTFNGIIYPTVYDKASVMKTLSNDGSSPQRTFELQKNILFKGKARVVKGSFSFTFIVPKDIAYNFGKGRLSFYAQNGNDDASGFYDEIIIGGLNENALTDNTSPDLKLYMNDEQFVFGGVTNENPVIYAIVADESGINTVGNGIGHDITAMLDNESDPVYVLNDFYEADLDNFQKGKIIYQLKDLSEGNHSVKLKVWDIYNNSSDAYTEFTVASSAEIALKHVLNYPNPFTTNTQFYFEHNQAGARLDIQIQVFTITGKLVKTLNQRVTSEGFRNNGIEWDGKDEFGDHIGRGVYIYRLRVRNDKGAYAEKYEKLVLLR